MKWESHTVFTLIAFILIGAAAVWGTLKPAFQPMFTTFSSAMLVLAASSHINNMTSTWLNSGSNNTLSNSNNTTISVP